MASARSLNADLRTSEIPSLRTSYLGKGRGRGSRAKAAEGSAGPGGGTNGGDKEATGRNSPAEVGKVDSASKSENNALDLLKEMCRKRTGMKVIGLSPKEENVIKEKVLETVSTGTQLQSLASELYDWCLSDPATTACVASLCGTLAKFEKDDVCFRTVLMSCLKGDFIGREELLKGPTARAGRWLAFVCLLCDLYDVMRTSTNQYLHILEEPVYTCLAETLKVEELPDLHIDYATLKLKKIGRVLQEYQPAKMDLLMEGLRARLLGPKTTALGRLQLLETIELCASGWEFDDESASAYGELRQATKGDA